MKYPIYLAALGFAMPAYAEPIQLAAPVDIKFSATVVNYADLSEPLDYEAEGCMLNVQTGIVEC